MSHSIGVLLSVRAGATIACRLLLTPLLRLTGNRLGQMAAPAGAGLPAGVAGVAAPLVMRGALLLVSAGVAVRSPGPAGGGEGAGRVPSARRKGQALRRTSDI